MRTIVDVSLYPLQNDFIPHIDSYIYMVQKNASLEVSVSDTSTTIKGDYDEVMSTLAKAMKEHLKSVPCTFNLRILGGETSDVPNKHKA